jgi:hypothetical protein
MIKSFNPAEPKTHASVKLFPAKKQQENTFSGTQQKSKADLPIP